MFSKLSKEEACEKEQEFIALYNTTDSEFGYNIEKGGFDNNRFTKDALNKMSNSHKGRKFSEERKRNHSKALGKGIHNVNYGRKQTAEARLHNSLAKRGENHPNYGKHRSVITKERIKKKNSKPVYQCDLNGDILQEWESAKFAASSLGLSYKAINNCLNGKSKQSFGYKWIYKNVKEKPSTTIPEKGVEH